MYLLMKTSKLAVFFLIGMILISCSGKYEKPTEQKIMLGNVTQGNGISMEDISETKADAAFALAMRLSGKYGFIDKFTRDSLAALMIDNGNNPKLLDIARTAAADELAFLRIDRFANIMRVDLQLVNVRDTSLRRKSEGYSFINFRDTRSNKALFDPSLLTAVQRAFAAAVGDSSLYMRLGPKLSVKPVPTMVVAGILFEETNGVRNWDLLDKKTVSSYSGVETISFAAKDSPDFLLYDIESRDSIYQVFKLYLVDNYNMPTLAEIDALRKFDIKYYLAGSYKQQQEYAELSLSIFEITKDNVNKLRTVNATLLKDHLADFSLEFENMTYELLNIPKKE